ncbi:transcription factor Ouib-like [Drosophila takahashii]|uniref:transcription factor Ouib-like n=1 Tax=Drosophila takahashii TaxID=29030 RepID=UPI001CF8FED3|nr:transcription factor Ouib-like [Drosophila takahashii]
MSMKCRICGLLADFGRKLFDIDGEGHLKNIHSLTGIWLIDKPGVPSTMCLSCLLDLNAAVAFRQRLIRTNHSWLEAQLDHSNKQELEPGNFSSTIQDDLKGSLEPPSSLEKPRNTARKKFTPLRYREPDEMPSNAVNQDDFVLSSAGDPSIDPPLCEDLIRVKNEPLLSDTELEDTRNQQGNLEYHLLMRQDLKGVENKPLLVDTEVEDTSRGVRNSGPPKRKRGRPRKVQQVCFFSCEECGTSFMEKDEYEDHLLRHSSFKLFQCEECNHQENTAHRLNLHVRIKHRGELPYMCRFCGQSFDRIMKKLRHERCHKEILTTRVFKKHC